MAAVQVYRRIANPYMPQGTPNLTNDPSPHYAPGELGCAFWDANTAKEWLRVELDSGATAATPVGAVQAGQLAFWRDKVHNIVTNDQRMSDVGAGGGAINRVAGVFATAVSTAPGVNGTDGQPLRYMCDLVIRGLNTQVQVSAAPTLGATGIADTTAGTARAVPLAVGTAPTSQSLGIFSSSTLAPGNLATMDCYIGFSE